MLLKITLALFSIFILFQLIYIFVPLFTVKNKLNTKMIKEKEKGISILVPAYNEEKVILNCVQGILHLDYENHETIIINDGSKDNTLQLLKENLQLEPTFKRLPAVKIPHEDVREIYQSALYPKILVIDKENGGKADALNAGIEYAKKGIVITLDADSVLDPKSLTAINSTFNDDLVLAAGGMVHIGQGFRGNYSKPKTTFLTSGIIRFQIIQYLTAFYLHKLTQTKMKSLTVIAGAFGAFRKRTLFEIDGFRKTVGEDMDITLRIQRLIKMKYRKHKLVFVPNALCYTECPETYRDLFSQRIRWQKAFVDCALMYKTSFFKKLGFRLSAFFLFESLLLGTINAFTVILIPVILILNHQYYMIALGLFTATFVLSLYQSIAMLIVSKRFDLHFSNKDYRRILRFLPFEILTYRFMGLLFVIIGTVAYFINKDQWNTATRTGKNYQVFGDEEVVLKPRRISA
ncbi:glycosyltransferase family 2 protein [Evansella tamaricis]|uniref:Glycosyltransferase n=1 Tax=Evansella tamaricis TaxID=2069301 RepID=A0ABS6JGT4_9BACI|nr:glycosyltransferase [Evansella tamaricis]MBU9711533.1 glycosyltransferase [Evansella tamaricis]